MEQFNQRRSDKVSPPSFSSKQIFTVLLITMLSGILGYFIGIRTGKSEKKQLAFRPTLTALSASPHTVSIIVPPMTLYPTSTPDPTITAWKAYTDARDGFSFMYPPYWTLNTNFDPDGSISPFIFDINTANASHNPLRMAMSIANNDNNWSLQQWFADIQTRTGQILPQQQVPIGGYPAIKTRTPSHLEDYYIIAPSLNTTTTNALYVIFFTSDGEGMDNPYPDTEPFVQQELTNFRQVISSFRFPK